MQSLTSRADLLACLDVFGTEGLPHFAEVFGLEFKSTKPVVSTVTEGTPIENDFSVEGFTPTVTVTEQPQAAFLQMTSYARHSEEEIVRDEPEWFKQAKSYQNDDPELLADPNRQPPPQPSLMSWHRMWPFLKTALGLKAPSHHVDLPRAVQWLANGKNLRCLPKRLRKGWAARAQVIIDFDESLVPFWSDFNDLHKRLVALRGQGGLDVLALPDGNPNGRCWRREGDDWRSIGDYRPPAPGTPVLILSDLGCNDDGEQRRVNWRRLGMLLARASCPAVAFLPSPPRWWDDETTRWFIPVYWDRHVSPPRQCVRSRSTFNRKDQPNRDLGERLLSLLAMAVRVEPSLLRAARFLLPSREADVGAEFAAWNHADVRATLLAYYIEPSKVSGYRDRLKNDTEYPPALRQQVADLIQRYHAHLSPVIGYEEQLAYAELFGLPLPDEAQTFAERAAKTMSKTSGELRQSLEQWLHRVGARQHESMWQHEALSAAWMYAQSKRDPASLMFPEGLILAKLAWVVGTETIVDRQIRQKGEALNIVDQANMGSRVAEIRMLSDVIQIVTKEAEGLGQSNLLPADQAIAITQNQSLTLDSGLVRLRFDWIDKPVWGEAIGRDRFGLYADLEYKGVVQRFRWINPGEFLMGSPPDDMERLDNELQHSVTLTQGFWLADTTCTQALWMAVMGNNPSHFKNEPSQPVESVSWVDAQTFIAALNERIAGLNVRLPTEAEWEYACRAGTTTRYSLGDSISLEQVNYGDFPSAEEKSGYRKQTITVKSLPPNGWGLFEMHGNVWEWCQDWYGDYSGQPEINPQGPENGSNRVLRGGSWLLNARIARSAYRFWYFPDDRNVFIGFRLALGRNGLVEKEIQARPAAA